MEVAILFAMVIGLMLIGVPIAVALGMSSIMFLLVLSDTSLASIAQTLFPSDGRALHAACDPVLHSGLELYVHRGRGAADHPLSPLPLSGIFRAVLRLRASLPVCCSPRCRVSALRQLLPSGPSSSRACVQVGYTKDFAAGVIANAGTLGILIPPSIVMVVYASATDVSVGRMFLAGVIPGLDGRYDVDGDDLRHREDQEPAQRASGRAGAKSGAQGRKRLGLVPDCDHSGRHLRGHLYPDRGAAVAAVYAVLIASFVYRDMGPLHVKGDGQRNLSCSQKPMR